MKIPWLVYRSVMDVAPVWRTLQGENVSSVWIGTGKLKPAFSMADQQHINLSAHISHLLLINILWTERVRRNHRWHSITSGLVSIACVSRMATNALKLRSHWVLTLICVSYITKPAYSCSGWKLKLKRLLWQILTCSVNLFKQFMLFKIVFNRSICRGSLWHFWEVKGLHPKSIKIERKSDSESKKGHKASEREGESRVKVN